MNCRTAKILLQDFVDGNLAGTDTGLISAHLQECAACREDHQRTLQIIEMLKEISVEPPSAGFAERALGNAAPSRPAIPVSRGKWLPAGIAASLVAIFFMFSANILLQPVQSDPSVVLIDGQVKTIRLAIESSRNFDDIELTISVSDNLKVEGFGDGQAISWTTRLEQGVNLIALPVSAILPGDGEIVARVGLADKEKVYRVQTRYRAAGNVSIDSTTIAWRLPRQQTVKL